MQVKFYKSLWGMGGDLPAQLAKIKEAGYDGFEQWVVPHFTVRKACADAGVEYLGMCAGNDPEQFKRDLGELNDGGAVKVTVHCGGAHWTFDEGAKFFEAAMKITETVPFQVNFETHRGRLLYEPLSTAKYLEMFPGLHLCADLSHWTVVTESMLSPFGPALELAIQRTRHIHARVGHEEGPQVPDPRSDRWKGHVDAFDKMWDRIHAAHVKRGDKIMTVDPEFGPPNYMWSDPKTGTPTADLWDVCLWMKDRLKQRWA